MGVYEKNVLHTRNEYKKRNKERSHPDTSPASYAVGWIQNTSRSDCFIVSIPGRFIHNAKLSGFLKFLSEHCIYEHGAQAPVFSLGLEPRSVWPSYMSQ